MWGGGYMKTHAKGNDKTASWIDDELAGCEFADIRLEKRFRTLVEQLSEGIGESIPMACQDWTGAKAAYRFFSNNRVSEARILSGHFQATRNRFHVTKGTLLVLHDTTEFSFKREEPQHWDNNHDVYRPGKAESTKNAHGLRPPDAFEFGGNNGRRPFGVGSDQILVTKEVQGDESAQEENQPNPSACRTQRECPMD
jgi:hypothetical protein